MPLVLRARTAAERSNPQPRPESRTSARRDGAASDLRPRRPHPSRRYRPYARRGSARWFGRAWAEILGLEIGQVNKGRELMPHKQVSQRPVTLRTPAPPITRRGPELSMVVPNGPYPPRI